MQTNLRISAIIPVYNDSQRLELCLKSLEKQDIDEPYEIIVVDNGSDENILEVTQKFSGVRYIYEQKVGSYAARNTGIGEAKGEFIAFTDADCIVAPDWLKQALNYFENYAECGAVGGKIELFSRSNIPNAFERYDQIFGFPQKKTVKKWGYSVTANLVVRKSAFETVGLFDERLKSGGDVEWSKRFVESGGVLHYCPIVLVKHPAISGFKQFYNKYSRIAGGMYEKNNMNLKDIFHFGYHRILGAMKSKDQITKATIGEKTIKRLKISLINYLKIAIYVNTFFYLYAGGKQRR